jgi:hypothetical protein
MHTSTFALPTSMIFVSHNGLVFGQVQVQVQHPLASLKKEPGFGVSILKTPIQTPNSRSY